MKEMTPKRKFNIKLIPVETMDVPHFIINWKGDWNDADYVHDEEIWTEDTIDEMLLKFLAYYGKIDGQYDNEYEDTPFYILREHFGCCVPYGYEQDIHSLTWDIRYVKADGSEYDVELLPLTEYEKKEVEDLIKKIRSGE